MAPFPLYINTRTVLVLVVLVEELAAYLVVFEVVDVVAKWIVVVGTLVVEVVAVLATLEVCVVRRFCVVLLELSAADTRPKLKVNAIPNNNSTLINDFRLMLTAPKLIILFSIYNCSESRH